MANNQGNYTNKFPDKQNRGKGTGRTPGEKIKAFFSSSSKKTDPVKTKLRGKSVAKAATPKKIVKKKDTKEVKRETRTAGYSGAKGDSGLPPRHSKNEMGTSGKAERTAQKRAKDAKDDAAKKAKAKKSEKRAAAKKKDDKFDFAGAIRRGFGGVR